MEIRQLEYFVEVMRSNSFTKAADSLYITQQGISKSVKRLEQELGVPLFSRSASAIVPTKFAEVFLPYAIDMIGKHKGSLEAIDKVRKQRNTELRIGVSPGLVNLLTSGALSEFMGKNRSVIISLSEFSDEALDKAIENDLVDIGLCILPVDESKLVIHHIRQERTCYMLSEQHPLANRETISLADLKDELFIGFGTKNKGHIVFEEKCEEFGFKPKMGIQTQDVHMIEELCRTNMGISFFVGEKNTVIPGVKIIPDASGDWYYRMAVTTKKGKPLTEETVEIISVLKG